VPISGIRLSDQLHHEACTTRLAERAASTLVLKCARAIHGGDRDWDLRSARSQLWL
jgi:hypothetical protein